MSTAKAPAAPSDRICEKILYVLYQFLFDRNDYRADQFQIVRDCSIVSVVNNGKIFG